MATEEPLSLTEEEQCKINASLCLIYSKLNGRLKSITVQNQHGFINYGRQREKITVNLIESDCIMVNKDKFDVLSEKNNVSLINIFNSILI